LKNREVTRLDGQKSAFKTVPTERPVPVDTTAVMAERKGREAHNRDYQNLSRVTSDALTNLEQRKRRVEELKRALAAAEEEWSAAELAWRTAKEQLNDFPPMEKFDDLDAQLSSAAQVATDIAAFDQYDKVTRELHTAKVEVEKLTNQIESLRADRADALKKAEFPVEGLGIDLDGNVTFNNVPFNQESQAKRLRIAVALLVAANPKMRFCFIQNGALMDAHSQAALAELCKTYNLQCFIEVLASDDPATIQLVDGEVVK
jgi:hypothetical protein